MKETQENELLTLIKYINLSPNKKLILNSRVAIFNTAKSNSIDLVQSFEKKEFHVFIIDMNNLLLIEKAKFFYNHMFFNEIPYEYFLSIKNNRNYIKIIEHPNYNPRIIDFACSNKRYTGIKPEEYFEYIFSLLDNPTIVWDDEYKKKSLPQDRILLNTLYSLTETHIDIKLLKNCFNYRMSTLSNLDTTINYFDEALKRLNGSFLKIIDVNNTKNISVSNPSVNDYINQELEHNTLEKTEIINSCCSIRQLERLLSKEKYNEKLIEIITNSEILNYYFDNNTFKVTFIVYQICVNQILNIAYVPIIREYLISPTMIQIDKKIISVADIITLLCNDKIMEFYEIKETLGDLIEINIVSGRLDFPDLVSFITNLYLLIEENEYYGAVNASDLNFEDYIDDIIKNYTQYNEDEDYDYIDTINAADGLENLLENEMKDELYYYLDKLPDVVRKGIDIEKDIYICVSGGSIVIESYYETESYQQKKEDIIDHSAIDAIFNR